MECEEDDADENNLEEIIAALELRIEVRTWYEYLIELFFFVFWFNLVEKHEVKSRIYIEKRQSCKMQNWPPGFILLSER